MSDDRLPAPTGGTWSAPLADFARAEQAVVWAELAELGLIEADGADAAAFLHSQLTNDVVHQDDVQVLRNGYCSAKGRLLATFDLWRSGDTVYLQLPREILAPVLKRLSMFVLRARVRLVDASSAWTTFAVLGPGSGTALGAEALAADQTIRVGPSRVTRLAPASTLAERYLLRCPRVDAAAWRDRLGSAAVDAGVWWWSQIDAGLPTVFAATQDQFVPQMINYEVVGGVNFKKGCYPGQEVVARSQYLGKLRRRMNLARIDGASRAGADVYAQGEAQPVGRVVMAAATPQGGMDLLFECPVERATSARLLVNDANGPALILRSLPYPLIDVTA